MKTKILTLLAAGVFLFGSSGARAVDLDISTIVGAALRFTGGAGDNDTFTFMNDAGGHSFTIAASDGAPPTSVNSPGAISGTFTIGPEGPAGHAAVSGTGTLTINDGAATFTATIDWVSIDFVGTSGFLNVQGTVNLTARTYNGTKADLLTLATAPTVIATLQFGFVPARTLADLKTTGAVNDTTFSGDLFGIVPPVTANCVAINNAVAGVPITPVQMVGSGGCGGPYTFSAVGLPPNVTMSSSGLISGTPLNSGNFNYTVTVTDNCGNSGTVNCSVTVGGTPCLELIKTASSATVPANGVVTYTYVVTNCGSTTFTSLAVVDDNGTPGVPGDDFTVGTIPSLAPGQTATFAVPVTVQAPSSQSLCVDGSPGVNAGTLAVEVLASGDIKVTLRQSRDLNDNVYGAPAPADGWSSHSFGNLTGSDRAEFRFTDGAGNVVLDFFLDYLTSTTVSAAFPSGYRSFGPTGGDGSMVSGNPAYVLSWTTTLADNLNSGLNGGFPSPYLVNSPTPESSFPNWDYVNGYTVVVSASAFGAAGFGGVTIPLIHNSPAKTGDNAVSPVPCGGCVTNTATAGTVSVVGGQNVFTPLTPAVTDDAVVCFGTPGPTCDLTPGTLKIDKKTVQLPIKNNGTADIFLSELALAWPQAVNGNLVKVSLNGDAWVGSAPSPQTLTVADFVADANKRKIAHGQTKTLVLTFANNASKDPSLYSGTIKFGADASCEIPFPPPTQPAPFNCDGHIVELQMKWMGSEPIKVVAHYGALASAVIATIDNVAIGQVVTVNGYLNSPNDVTWEIFQAGTNVKLGESQFHVSCSDSTMDGPEDCGSAQGNGKSNLATLDGFPTLNVWQFVGLTTKNGTTLLCP